MAMSSSNLRAFEAFNMDQEQVRRFQKRADAIERVYQSAEYKQAKRRPQSPDPADLSISKRAWEKKLKAWQSELKAAALGNVLRAPTPSGDGQRRS